MGLLGSQQVRIHAVLKKVQRTQGQLQNTCGQLAKIFVRVSQLPEQQMRRKYNILTKNTQ